MRAAAAAARRHFTRHIHHPAIPVADAGAVAPDRFAAAKEVMYIFIISHIFII